MIHYAKHGLRFAILPFFFFVLAGCNRTPPAETTAQPAKESAAGTAREAPPPSYVPVTDPSIQGVDAGTEYLITGKITDETLLPLAEATISAYGSPPRWSPPALEQPALVDTQTCDQEGRYQIKLKVPANLWVSLRKEGYAQINVFLPVRDPKTTIRDFQLPRAISAVSGLVVDKKEQPIPGVLVVANPPPLTLLADSAVLAPVAQTTDANGRYMIQGLPGGDVSLLAIARGCALQEQLIPVREAQTEQVNFSLATSPCISFPVKNSRAEALPFAMATAPGFVKIAGADKRGVIEFCISQEISPFDCTVTAEGYRPVTVPIDPKAPPSAILLEDKPLLTGRVLTESGAAIEGALASVWGTGGPQGKFDGAINTDKTGRFTLPMSYPPAREIRVSAPGFLEQRVTFDGKKPAGAETIIRLKRVEAGLFGRVIDYRGIPVKRFVLHLREEAANSVRPDYQRSYNVENGRFTVTDVAPGTYTLIIQSVAASTAEDVQVLRQDGVEIRKGFFLGEFTAQFSKPKYAK
jgi:hypothetical protein